MDVHYYSTETTARAAASALPTMAPGSDSEAVAPPTLRLGRISAGAHLGKKVVYRSSSVELGMYDDKRWTERPDEYVRRAISAALFDSQRATQSLPARPRPWTSELLAFERSAEDKPDSVGSSKVKVSLRYSLHMSNASC